MAKRKRPSANGENGAAPTAPSPAAPTPPDGRDPGTGRFAPGWKGGPGNPFNRQIASFKRAIFRGVTEEDFVAITQKLVAMARSGDLAAVELLFRYCVGSPPKSTLHPDLEELDEIQTTQVIRRERKNAVMMEILDS